MNATLRERLPSAAAAIGLQAGLFALLAVSFNAVRHMGEEKETILVLPPLARPALPPPMTIDARGRRKTAPTATSVLPGSTGANAITAAPPAGGSSLEGGALQAAPLAPDCIPQGQARPVSRTPCPLPPRAAQTDDIPLHPESHVKDEAHWAEQWEREHDPYLPGVTATERGIHVDLFNSNGPSLLGGYRTPTADPTHAHASEAEFQKALAAHQARQRELYAPPRPAAAP